MNKKLIFSFSLLIALAISLVLWRAHHKMPPYLTIVGPVNMADGLGSQALELFERMHPWMKTDLIPTQVQSTVDVPKHIFPMFRSKKRPLGSVVFCQEPLRESIGRCKAPRKADQVRIAYSMCESTAVPQDWVQRLNNHFDLVAVPDPFLIDVFQKSGVKIPLFVLPLARQFSPFLEAPLKTTRNPTFVFGYFGAGHARKNHACLIRAFHKAFKGRSDVCLAIHCRCYSAVVRERIMTEIARAEGSCIRFTEEPLSRPDYLKFFQSIDCYVSPSKGEGFSIQPREAMALGIPTIVADNSAQHTICESGLVRVVPSPLLEPARYEWCPEVSEGFGDFASCTEEDLTAALLEVEQNYSKHLAKSVDMRKWASQYDYPSLEPLYLSLIQPKKILLGDKNTITKDAVITSSIELYGKYRRL